MSYTYPDKFMPDNIVAPSVLLQAVIVTLPFETHTSYTSVLEII